MGYKKAEFVTGKGRDTKIMDGASVQLTTEGWEAVNEAAAESYANAVQENYNANDGNVWQQNGASADNVPGVKDWPGQKGRNLVDSFADRPKGDAGAINADKLPEHRIGSGPSWHPPKAVR